MLHFDSDEDCHDPCQQHSHDASHVGEEVCNFFDTCFKKVIGEPVMHLQPYYSFDCWQGHLHEVQHLEEKSTTYWNKFV